MGLTNHRLEEHKLKHPTCVVCGKQNKRRLGKTCSYECSCELSNRRDKKYAKTFSVREKKLCCNRAFR